MNSRPSALPVQMARRVSRRFAQCAAAAAAGFVMVSLIGSGIVRQSFERIAAKAAVLAEIGVEPLVNPSHFLSRSFIQNLTAGSFFGVTIGLAAGVGIFFVCVLVESLSYRKLRAACMALLCLLLAWLSHQIFQIGPGVYGLLVWIFPAAIAAVCEAASPTPVWTSSSPSSEPTDEETPGAGRRVSLLLILFNAAAAAAMILWTVQFLSILRYDAARKNLFAYFRDDMLLGAEPGAALDRFYYRHSPYAAEFASPTQFQPIIIAVCGLADETTDSIPRYHIASLLPVRTVLPVYTVPMPDLETAANRFASGAFDILILQPSSLGMTPEETEELLEKRTDLPDNWRVRCVIITDRRQSEPPVWVKRSKTAVSNAVRRAIFDMIATGPSEPIRNLLDFCFVRPLLRIFKRPLFPAGFLAVVLWLCILAHACSSRGTVRPILSVLISAVFAAVLWWTVITGWTERKALAETLNRLENSSLSAGELEALLSSNLAVKRYATLRHLENWPDSANAERALGLLSDPDARVRMRSMHLLGTTLKSARSQSLRNQALPQILMALHDKSFHVRYAAAEAAASAGFPEAEPELLDLIRKNEHLYVTWYAVNALHRMRAESAR